METKTLTQALKGSNTAFLFWENQKTSTLNQYEDDKFL